MTGYTKELLSWVGEYRSSGKKWPAQARDIARWAIDTGRWKYAASTALKACTRDFAEAMREDYITDTSGRRVRAKHPARTTQDGEQVTLWDDIRTAPRDHMELAFSQRRNLIVGDCRQLKTDADSWNDAHPKQESIQIVFNFEMDLAEMELAY